MKAILVADDEAIFAETLASILGDAGYRCEVAWSGRQVLDLLDRERFDLVLLDVMMPGMDGPTTLAKVRARAHDASMPVILMSGLTESAVTALLKHPIDGYLQKDFDDKTLLDAVRKALPD